MPPQAPDPTDAVWALTTARRAAGDRAPGAWADEDWNAVLAETAETRGGQTVYDPYLAAERFVTSPEAVSRRTEGDSSEDYRDLGAILASLRDQSARLRTTHWPAPDTPDPEPGPGLDLTITFGGW